VALTDPATLPEVSMTTNQTPIDVSTFAITFFEGAHRTAI
jgi:hypothetical protein